MGLIAGENKEEGESRFERELEREIEVREQWRQRDAWGQPIRHHPTNQTQSRTYTIKERQKAPRENEDEEKQIKISFKKLAKIEGWVKANLL